MAKSVRDMVSEAEATIETLNVDEAKSLNRDEVVFVDIREESEVAKGTIPGSVLIPRGLLEFQADPSLPNAHPSLTSGKKLVLFCAAGGRSALAGKTLKELGYKDVAHIGGGYTAWHNEGGPTTS